MIVSGCSKTLKAVLKPHALIPNYRLITTIAKPIDFTSLPEHRSLMIEKNGEPVDVVMLNKRSPDQVLPKYLESNQVLVEHLASTINPADINIVQGVYGTRPELPAILGNEGVGRVKLVGSNVKHVKPGDHAITINKISQCWQSYSVQNADYVFKVDSQLDIKIAAQLKVNPCTAYRMIKDFYPLKPGDTIIQNGANSAVGVYAIQLAKYWGLKTINVIRDKPNKEEIIQELKDFGADTVITEEEVSKVEYMRPIIKELGSPKLFFNCVGGKNAINCQRYLDHSGYSITYGAMSKQPFSLSAASLIFKDHKFVGFWVSRWFTNAKRSETQDMIDEIVDMFKRGILRSKSTTTIDFEQRNAAFSGSNNTKYVFLINK